MNERGQALIEALASTLLLVPLLLAVVQLALVQSTEQAALGAARSAAFAAHLGLDGATGPLPVSRVRELFFPEPDAAGRVEVARVAQPAAAATAEDVAMALLLPAIAVGSGGLELRRDRALEARAGAAPPRVFGDVAPGVSGLRLSARLPLMADDWDAGSASEVAARAAALSTAGRIAAWRGPLSAMAAPMRLLEPAVERLCLGRIDPDIVPQDRLSGLARAPDLRTQPC